jgi:hypothetical protein
MLLVVVGSIFFLAFFWENGISDVAGTATGGRDSLQDGEELLEDQRISSSR